MPLDTLSGLSGVALSTVWFQYLCIRFLERSCTLSICLGSPKMLSHLRAAAVLPSRRGHPKPPLPEGAAGAPEASAGHKATR